MSPEVLEQLLKSLPANGTRIKDRGYRQVWKFEVEGRGYYLKFYPRRGTFLKRLIRGSPARREFIRLQALQKADIPAPRAIAHLSGYRIEGQEGDAVILGAIEPAVALDAYFTEFGLRGEVVPDHLSICQKMIAILEKLGRARLGHDDLHLGNFLMQDGAIYLLDGYAVRFGGLTLQNVMKLAHSVRSLATRADLQRGWNRLGPGGYMPGYNTVSKRQWGKFIDRTHCENDYFGRLRFGIWSGFFFKRYKYPRRWAPASSLHVSKEDWDCAWPALWDKIEKNELEVIKRGASGDVLGGELELGGKTVPIIVKRPFKRYWYRYINEIGRGSRSWRAWRKGWMLVIRDIPTAWPLMVLQKRDLGYITDSVIVFERLAGHTLAAEELDRIETSQREMLFRRTGAILRKIDDLRLSHFDAKAGNWIVQQDPKLGPHPVLIDVDGIRLRPWRAEGISRLLRSMREHPQYSVADSLALCQGYTPYSTTQIVQEA